MRIFQTKVRLYKAERYEASRIFVSILLSAAFASSLNSALAADEDCGNAVIPITSPIDNFFRSKEKIQAEKDAAAKYDACASRNHERRESISKNVVPPCKQAIRNLMTVPTTAVWYDNYLNVRETEGGYETLVSGTSSDGSFHITCYTDNSFRVTSLRNSSIYSGYFHR